MVNVKSSIVILSIIDKVTVGLSKMYETWNLALFIIYNKMIYNKTE